MCTQSPSPMLRTLGVQIYRVSMDSCLFSRDYSTDEVHETWWDAAKDAEVHGQWHYRVILWKVLVIGEIPNSWKRTNVTPIFKKGQKKDLGNFSSVSLTSVPGDYKANLLEGTSRNTKVTENSMDLPRQIMPDQLSCLLRDNWLCGQGEGSMCCFPWPAWGLWNNLPKHPYSQTGEIQTEEVDYQVGEKVAGLLGSKSCGQWYKEANTI